MKRILVTGALGQIGSELATELRRKHGADQVVATDIRMPADAKFRDQGPFDFMDVLNPNHITRIMQKYDVGVVYHLAALLSAVGETRPTVAWEVNVNGLYNVLEAARQYHCAIFFPSSIGAFGPDTPKQMTPQNTIQRPTTMYGISKVAGELLCDYYFLRFGVDARGVRFPGLVSWETEPGGGTTDYAVEMFFRAVKYGTYTCYLSENTRLDMMFMPDAIRSMTELMEADPTHLKHRNSFNVTAMNFTPAELAVEIRKHIPGFKVQYRVDATRQAIADSWPDSLDDSAARAEWGWSPKYDLAKMVKEMLDRVQESQA